MLEALEDPRIRRVIALDGGDDWRPDLERLMAGDQSLTRASAGEAGLRGIQRLFVFLGYSTSAGGSFSIDGDFGRGTNRALAQFQFDQGLSDCVTREHLTYESQWNTAAKNIVAIPDVRLDMQSLDRMLSVALEAIETGKVALGDFDTALLHLDLLQRGRGFDCAQILEQYGDAVDTALARLRAERGIDIAPEWILAIIRQETAGVVRPRFEQHWLTKLNKQSPAADLVELRYQAMSFGLGQILGINADRVGAPSAQAMFTSPLEDQIFYIARFLESKKDTLQKENPTLDDFAVIAKYYNGPAYAAHFYHERIQTWFNEFRKLRSA